MSLTSAVISSSVDWTYIQAVTGFQPIKQGPDSLIGNITYSTSDVTKLIPKQYVVAGGGTQDIDLQTELDLSQAAAGCTKAVAIQISVTGNDIKITGHGTNGLAAWFIRNSGEFWIPAGGFATIAWPFSKAVTIDGTHKKLVITNSSGASATVTIAFLGA